MEQVKEGTLTWTGGNAGYMGLGPMRFRAICEDIFGFTEIDCHFEAFPALYGALNSSPGVDFLSTNLKKDTYNSFLCPEDNDSLLEAQFAFTAPKPFYVASR
jgi:hypothetical protein